MWKNLKKEKYEHLHSVDHSKDNNLKIYSQRWEPHDGRPITTGPSMRFTFFFSGDNNPKCLDRDSEEAKKKSKNFLTDVYKLTIGAHKYS